MIFAFCLGEQVILCGVGTFDFCLDEQIVCNVVQTSPSFNIITTISCMTMVTIFLFAIAFLFVFTVITIFSFISLVILL